ncbi:MAG: PBSX family phage terminase large subunit [Clostridium sp.]|uniref:PBSX family phage terminase large subunit n=1 Tax=Clostridium sp. TaxID=1506 RepID=UPI0029005B62|nr:PBSX family phage terminase large subunit [Clostridium sp.]MDU1605019.1 PBSX family phage terminase large subunit [Clostridium sp.]
MELSPRQIESWAASTNRDNFTLWDGAIRSGKTIISLIAFIHWLSNAPRGPVAILGKTRTTIIRNVLDVIAMIAPKAIGGYGMASERVKIMGRWVWIVGANDAQAESKIRGLTLAGAYVDEATLLPEAMFVQLLGRLSVTGARLFATTNPDSPSHWLKTNYIDRINELDGWGFWHFTMDDNPGLTPEYVAAKKKEFTGLWYRRFIQGEWVSAEGAVYDMWDPTTHVVPWDSLPRMVDCYAVGIDYGTQNPTAAIILAMGENGHLYLADEFRIDATNRGHGTWTDREQSEALLRWLKEKQHFPHPENADLHPRRLIVDPAAASFKVQLQQDNAWGLTDADNDVLYGIRLVANGLASGWLHVSDRCTGFIAEAPGYSWDPKAQLAGTDKPIKTADHSLDAARYALTTTERLWRPTIERTLHTQ